MNPFKLLDAFNSWYDDLREPKRFLVFFIPMTITVVSISIKTTMFYGLLGLSIIGMVAASRANKMGDKMVAVILFATMVALFFLSAAILLV